METTPASQVPSATAESKLEKQSARGVMCQHAEEAIARRAQNNDAALIDAIIPDPLSDVVCIPASFVASLPELVDFTPKLDAAQREKFLVSVLESSEHLKTMKDKDGKVIIRTEYKRNPRNTLLMHNVPADAKENDLRELFLSIPTAASVSFKKDVNACWLATFDTEANAVATHSSLFGKKLMIKDSVISVGLRATRFVRITPATPATTTPATTGVAQPGPYSGMRQQGMPPGMRQPYQFTQQQYWMTQMQPYYMQPYYGMPQQRVGGQHQPWMMQQQKSRGPRSGGGHPRYQNPAGSQQQQRAGAAEQVAAPHPATDAAAATTAPAAAATTAPAAAAAPQQPQQQQRDGPRQGGGRGNRGYRNRNRGPGGNRGHGGQSGAASEGAAAEGASAEQHSKHQRQSAERQEAPAKPQKKPTADSFPPLA